MPLRTRLLLLAAAGWLPGTLPAPAAAPAPRPNIVYFYADDLGWGSIGANGQDRILTPGIDSIADTGVNFVRGYGCPVCSPARSSQQTGFHQGHTWTDRNDPSDYKAMREEDPTIGDLLAEAGYRTGYFGKWGYGADSTLVDPRINNPQTLPLNHGYDEVLAELHHVRAHTYFQPTLWRSNTSDPAPTTALVPNVLPGGAPAFPAYPAYPDDPGYPQPAYADDAYAFAALDFVRRQARSPEPFFCLLAFQVPHTPLGEVAALPRWFDAYADVPGADAWPAEARQYAAMITRMDAHVGNILAALEDPDGDGNPDDSVLGNTLVVFSSDNGGQAGSPLSFFSGNAHLRGAKGSVFEGGIRVPTLMQWRGVLPAGAVSSRVVDVSDMLPTFAELAGVPIPVGTDGVSLAPTLTGQGVQRPRSFVVHESGSSWSIIRGRHKLTRQSGSLQLYDLEADPSETTNLAADEPALRDELHALALGERVEEPYGFANTHHAWTGPDQGVTSDPDHWSDTQPPNPLIDTGAPRLSWNATMAKPGPGASTAVADADLETLGFEVLGSGPDAPQVLDVGAYTLLGRNEIRVGAHGEIRLNNGTLASLRWVDLQADAALTGAGTVDGDLYHAGRLAVAESAETTIPGPDITVPGPDITVSNGANIVANGGFEDGEDTGGGDYSFDTLAHWHTDPGLDTGRDAAKPSSAYAGTMRGLLQAGAADRYPLVQDTGIPIALGESFDLSFWHRGFSNWEDTDRFRVRVYYEDAGGQAVDLLPPATVPVPVGTWNPAAFTVPPVTDPGAVGRTVHVRIAPDSTSESGTEYASLDEVVLVRHGGDITVPGPDITIPGPDIVVPGVRRLTVTGDYRASPGSVLALALASADTPGEDHVQLAVTGTATLAGTLEPALDPGLVPVVGDRFTILSAASVAGRWAHADDMVAAGGHAFRIHYEPAAVVLERVGVTARGTPHWWLAGHGHDGPDFEAAELRDDDGDGMAAWEEYRAGTDPQEAASRLALRLQSDPLKLEWSSASNRLYTLETATDLAAGFGDPAGPFAASPPVNVLTNLSLTGLFQAYRVAVERQ